MSNDTEFKQTEPVSPVIKLNAMNDDEIKQLISEGYKLLNQRKREREKALKIQIREMASQAGIKVSFSERRRPKKK